MSTYAFAVCGFLLGAAIQLAGFSHQEPVRQAVCLSDWASARVLLDTLGLGMMMTACLCYLAVIDVDLLEMVPLTSNLLLGGILFGAAVGFSGFLPGTILAGVGGGRFIESLLAVLGCVAGRLIVSLLPSFPLPSLFPPLEGTLFHLTLKDPNLLGGSFAALACLGALVCVTSLLFRPTQKKVIHNESTSGELSESADHSVPSQTSDSDIDPSGDDSSDEDPVMTDHPDLDSMPETDDDPPLLEVIAEAQAQSGLSSPAQEADLPNGARALLTNHPDDDPASGTPPPTE